MKTLPFQRDEKKQRVTVACADGDVSVYSHCAYCRFCTGVRVNDRVSLAPQSTALADIRRGRGADDNLMNAAMLFNTLVRDGTAIECSDDENRGFVKLY
jgi:cytochrome c5